MNYSEIIDNFPTVEGDLTNVNPEIRLRAIISVYYAVRNRPKEGEVPQDTKYYEDMAAYIKNLISSTCNIPDNEFDNLQENQMLEKIKTELNLSRFISSFPDDASCLDFSQKDKHSKNIMDNIRKYNAHLEEFMIPDYLSELEQSQNIQAPKTQPSRVMTTAQQLDCLAEIYQGCKQYRGKNKKYINQIQKNAEIALKQKLNIQDADNLLLETRLIEMQNNRSYLHDYEPGMKPFSFIRVDTNLDDMDIMSQTVQGISRQEKMKSNVKVGKDEKMEDLEGGTVQYYAAQKREERRVHFMEGRVYHQGNQFGEMQPLSTKAGRSFENHMFVLDKQGRMYVGKEIQEHRKHSTFMRGEAVIVAGNVKVNNGKIEYVDNDSGHYKPSREQFLNGLAFLMASGMIDENTKIGIKEPSGKLDSEGKPIYELNQYSVSDILDKKFANMVDQIRDQESLQDQKIMQQKIDQLLSDQIDRIDSRRLDSKSLSKKDRELLKKFRMQIYDLKQENNIPRDKSFELHDSNRNILSKLEKINAEQKKEFNKNKKISVSALNYKDAVAKTQDIFKICDKQIKVTMDNLVVPPEIKPVTPTVETPKAPEIADTTKKQHHTDDLEEEYKASAKEYAKNSVPESVEAFTLPTLPPTPRAESTVKASTDASNSHIAPDKKAVTAQIESLGIKSKEVQDLCYKIFDEKTTLEELDDIIDSLQQTENGISKHDFKAFKQLVKSIQSNHDSHLQAFVNAQYAEVYLQELKASIHNVNQQIQAVSLDNDSKVLKIAAATINNMNMNQAEILKDLQGLLELVDWHNGLAHGDSQYQLQENDNLVKLSGMIEDTISKSVLVDRDDLNQIEAQLTSFKAAHNISTHELDIDMNNLNKLESDKGVSNLLTSFKSSLKQMNVQKQQDSQAEKWVADVQVENTTSKKMKL